MKSFVPLKTKSTSEIFLKFEFKVAKYCSSQLFPKKLFSMNNLYDLLIRLYRFYYFVYEHFSIKFVLPTPGCYYNLKNALRFSGF